MGRSREKRKQRERKEEHWTQSVSLIGIQQQCLLYAYEIKDFPLAFLVKRLRGEKKKEKKKENRRPRRRLSVSFKAKLRWMHVIGSKLRINYKGGYEEEALLFLFRSEDYSCSRYVGEPLTTIDPTVSNVDFKAVEHDRQVTLQTLLHGTDAPTHRNLFDRANVSLYCTPHEHGNTFKRVGEKK